MSEIKYRLGVICTDSRQTRSLRWQACPLRTSACQRWSAGGSSRGAARSSAELREEWLRPGWWWNEE